MIPVKVIEEGERKGVEATAGEFKYTVLLSVAGDEAAHVKIEKTGKVLCDDELPAKIDWTAPWKMN